MTDQEGTTVTHVAGSCITFDGHMRQRCEWCGCVLIDYELSRVMVQNKPDGSPGDPPGSWAPGALVRTYNASVGGGVGSVVEPEPSEQDPDCVKPPDDCCLRLPPELTLNVQRVVEDEYPW